jgi:hypothetical protein
MNGQATAADPRMEFFEIPDAAPAPTPAPSPRPAYDLGPSVHHRLHGQIKVPRGELRVTSQPARGPEQPARLVIRVWHARPADQSWWTDPGQPGVFITAKDARAFADAVAAAAAALEADERQLPTSYGRRA